MILGLDQKPKQIIRENDTFKSINSLYKGRKLVFNARSPFKSTQRKVIKILAPKQIL